MIHPRKVDGLGRRVLACRHDLDLSQLELAVEVGCGQKHISQIERGTSDPGAWLLLALARELRVSPNWLLGWSVLDSKLDG